MSDYSPVRAHKNISSCVGSKCLRETIDEELVNLYERSCKDCKCTEPGLYQLRVRFRVRDMVSVRVMVKVRVSVRVGLGLGLGLGLGIWLEQFPIPLMLRVRVSVRFTYAQGYKCKRT